MARLTYWNGKKYCLPQGMWREIADRLAAYENTGLEPEEIAALQAADSPDDALPAKGDIFTAVIIVREMGGYVPYIDPTTCCARVYAADVEEYADNPEVIRERGANHLVIQVYEDHWHVAQVGGYAPEAGLYTKLY